MHEYTLPRELILPKEVIIEEYRENLGGWENSAGAGK